MPREKGILIQLYDDEKLVAVLRKHWFGMLNSILLVIGLVIFFIIGFVLAYRGINSPENLNTVITDSVRGHIAQGALTIFGSIYLMSVFGFAYVAWLDYYLDLFIITDKRVLRVEQAILFDQKISETSFQHIQDVSSQVKGLISTLLNVGTIYIETAGEKENFSFTYIHDPASVTATILELQKTMWDSEGFKGDLSNERRHQKIEAMNRTIDYQGNYYDETEKEDAVIVHNITEESKPYFDKEVVADSAAAEKDYVEKKPFEAEGSSPKVEEIPKVEKAPKIEELPKKEIKKDYNDGRIVTSFGVIWQSEQELTTDVLDVLNGMEKGEDVIKQW